MRRPVPLASLPLTLLLAAAPAMAQPPLSIVITSGRTAEAADATMTPVTVITRKDIETSQANTLEEVLDTVPGLAIANTGGRGKQTSVFLRGTESDHVLVLVDGVKIGSVTAGTAAFQDIPLSLIDRIEVVRGPRSSLYGSEAIGGVIQIFTRRGAGPLRPHITARLGRYDTAALEAGLQGGVRRGWFNLSLSSSRTNGFNSCDVAAGSAFAGCFTSEPDNDGYENQAGALRLGYRLAEGLDAELSWMRTAGHADFDGSFVNGTDTVQFVGGARLRYAPVEGSNDISLSLGRNRDESDNLLNGQRQSTFDSQRDTVSLVDVLTLPADQRLTLGIDFEHDEITSDTAFAVTDRDNTAIFGHYDVDLGHHEFGLGLRRDDNEQFGLKTTGGLGWAYRLTDDLRFTAHYATAFKAPTFNELYFPGFSNADLRPERSRNLDAGIHGQGAHWGWDIDAYETHISDLIGYDASIGTPANISSTRLRGLELSAKGHWARWEIRIHLDLLKSENRDSGPNEGKNLPRRPSRRLGLDVSRRTGPWLAGIEWRAEAGRYDDLANQRRVPGFGLVDLRLERELVRALTLQARVENLFDKAYETVAFYPQSRRGVYLTLRYAP